MGSKITRALSRTERTRHHKHNQIQLKAIIKCMSMGMSMSTLYCLGFIHPETQFNQSLHTYITLSIIALIGLNKTNPNLCLFISLGMFVLNSIFFPTLTLLSDFLIILFTYILSGLIFNYYLISESSIITCSTIMLLYSENLIRLAKKCSYGLKLIRSDNTAIQTNHQHPLMIRTTFCLMGVLCCLLVLGAHKHIRRYRLPPLKNSQQINILTSNQFLSSLLLSIAYSAFSFLILTNIGLMNDSNQYGYNSLTISQQLFVIPSILLLGIGLESIFVLGNNNFFLSKLKILQLASLTILFWLNYLFLKNQYFSGASLQLKVLNIFVLIFIGLLKIMMISSIANLIVPRQRVNYAIISVILAQKIACSVYNCHYQSSTPLSEEASIAIWGICFLILLIFCLNQNHFLTNKTNKKNTKLNDTEIQILDSEVQIQNQQNLLIQ